MNLLLPEHKYNNGTLPKFNNLSENFSELVSTIN